MSDSKIPPVFNIPEGVMLARLAQSEQMREFFIQMWLQNPALAARTGRKMQDVLAAGCRPASADYC